MEIRLSDPKTLSVKYMKSGSSYQFVITGAKYSSAKAIDRLEGKIHDLSQNNLRFSTFHPSYVDISINGSEILPKIWRLSGENKPIIISSSTSENSSNEGESILFGNAFNQAGDEGLITIDGCNLNLSANSVKILQNTAISSSTEVNFVIKN